DLPRHLHPALGLVLLDHPVHLRRIGVGGGLGANRSNARADFAPAVGHGLAQVAREGGDAARTWGEGTDVGGYQWWCHLLPLTLSDDTLLASWTAARRGVRRIRRGASGMKLLIPPFNRARRVTWHLLQAHRHRRHLRAHQREERKQPQPRVHHQIAER